VTGRLLGIARAASLGAPLEVVREATVTVDMGIDGDVRGSKPLRQVTVLFREGWDDACREVGVNLPWITRRANLLVEGIDRPREAGGRLVIGEIVLDVVQETEPCHLMERAQAGLRKALTSDWRGGVCCKVLVGGRISTGDAVEFAR